MSQNTSLSGVLQQINSSLGPRPFKCPPKSQSCRNFKSGLVLIYLLTSKDESRGLIPHAVTLPSCIVQSASGLGSTQRIAQSVSFIATLVGVPLVACLVFFYSLIELDANRRMRPVNSYCSCILYS